MPKGWPEKHKCTCATKASSRAESNPFPRAPEAHSPGFDSANALLGLSGDDYIEKLPEKDAFVQLIDCFRMRMEDEYTFGANNFGMYGGENPVPVFKKFLDLEEKKNELLPSWWRKKKRKAYAG